MAEREKVALRALATGGAFGEKAREHRRPPLSLRFPVAAAKECELSNES
jgi:hypothetical protein